MISASTGLRLTATYVGIFSMAVLHILASGVDQFVVNVFQGEGALHQVLRDFGLMLPDLLHLCLPWYELRKWSRQKGIPIQHLFSKQDAAASVGAVIILWMVCLSIP